MIDLPKAEKKEQISTEDFVQLANKVKLIMVEEEKIYNDSHPKEDPDRPASRLLFSLT